jgi:flavin reductase (DIM6/NTAB) family NADH-FMN oxidoreductase RutF
MFYETSTNRHGLPFDPFLSCVVPRPIGWITTLSSSGGINLAPFSFFNGVGVNPPQVMYCTLGPHLDGGPKDSLANVEETGEFVVNLATYALRQQMNATSMRTGRNVSEAELAGLALAASRIVKPPRVSASPIHLECQFLKRVDMLSNRSDWSNTIVLGKVVGVHIADDVIVDGRVDIARIRPIARLGYRDYAVVDTIFTMEPPD